MPGCWLLRLHRDVRDAISVDALGIKLILMESAATARLRAPAESRAQSGTQAKVQSRPMHNTPPGFALCARPHGPSPPPPVSFLCLCNALLRGLVQESRPPLTLLPAHPSTLHFAPDPASSSPCCRTDPPTLHPHPRRPLPHSNTAPPPRPRRPFLTALTRTT